MRNGVGIEAFLAIGVIFGAFAAAIAFLVTYDEYSHHQLDRQRLLRLSGEAALFAFVVILLLALAAGFYLDLAD